MDKEKLRKQVAAIPAFTPLNASLRARVAGMLVDISTPQRIKTGTVIYRAGEPSNDDAYLVLDGELTVEKDDNPALTAYSPQLIGEMARVNPTRQRTATVTAATDVDALKFNWARLAQLASTKLSGEESQTLIRAIQDYAWQHFTE